MTTDQTIPASEIRAVLAGLRDDDTEVREALESLLPTPPSLADELRDMADKDERINQPRLRALADRVEAIEQRNDELEELLEADVSELTSRDDQIEELEGEITDLNREVQRQKAAKEKVEKHLEMNNARRKSGAALLRQMEEKVERLEGHVEDRQRVIQEQADHIERLTQPADATDTEEATPALQVIRTVEELEALDPDTAICDRFGVLDQVQDWALVPPAHPYVYLPAVVIATGEQVRAAYPWRVEYPGIYLDRCYGSWQTAMGDVARWHEIQQVWESMRETA